MKSVSKKTLRKSFLNWFFWNGCSQQAETMLGMAFGQAMAPRSLRNCTTPKKIGQPPFSAISPCSIRKLKLDLFATVLPSVWKSSWPTVMVLRKPSRRPK